MDTVLWKGQTCEWQTSMLKHALDGEDEVNHLGKHVELEFKFPVYSNKKSHPWEP